MDKRNHLYFFFATVNFFIICNISAGAPRAVPAYVENETSLSAISNRDQIIKTLFGSFEEVKTIEYCPNRIIDSSGKLVYTKSSYSCSKYNISEYQYIVVKSRAFDNSVYGYSIQEDNGIVLSNAIKNTKEKQTFIIPVLPNFRNLYICNVDYCYGTKDNAPVFEEINAIKTQSFSDNNNILWLGTSIPEGASYPRDAAANCGYNIKNMSLGSSQLIWRNERPSKVTSNSGKCLTATVAELEQVFRKDVIDGAISEASLDLWKSYCFENSVLPFINGADKFQASIIVIDHGFNDRKNIHELMSFSEDIDWNSRDRSNFVGAFNFLIDRIQEVNPFVKIVICGYFQDKYSPYFSKEICVMQELIGNHHSINVLKVWEHTQITDKYIAGSSKYIDDFNKQFGTSYTKKNPDSEGNILSLQLYCPDMIHPHSDLTGKCNKRLSSVVTKLLRDSI